MAMVVVDDSSLQAHSQPKSGGLVCGRLALFYIHQMNRVNSGTRFIVIMTLWSLWQHYKYRPGDYNYCYYYYYENWLTATATSCVRPTLICILSLNNEFIPLIFSLLTSCLCSSYSTNGRLCNVHNTEILACNVSNTYLCISANAFHHRCHYNSYHRRHRETRRRRNKPTKQNQKKKKKKKKKNLMHQIK